MRRSYITTFFLFFGLLLSLVGCALFGLGLGPEYSLVGCKVTVMPFSGPGDKWYGEDPVARDLYLQVVATLRAGGVEVRLSERVEKELSNYMADEEPQWVEYGRRLSVDYVIVGRLIDWEIGRPDAIAFVPGRAVMDVSLYNVQEGKLVLQRRIVASVGALEESEEFYTDRHKAKQILVKKLLSKWKGLFVSKSAFE